MRLILSFVLLSFFCSPVYAEWVKVAVSNRGTEYFVDNSSIFDQGRNYYIKTLVNYSYRQDTGELSSISDTILSCSRLMMKDTTLKTFTKRNGSGRKISDDDLVKYDMDFWRTSVKGSVEYLYVSRLCNTLQN